MSEENTDKIVDVDSYAVEFTNYDFPEEKYGKDGQNIPDPAFIDEATPEGIQEINERRQELSNLPPYPREWQTDSTQDESSKGFDDIKVNVAYKEQEIKKLIKKYKRYMKNNLTVAKRLES